MEFRMTRRDSVAGALLLGLTATFSASRVNASEDKQVVNASCLADLTDDELVLLEQMVAGEKRRRDVKSIQMQAGMYVAGVDIDPGSYILHVCTEDGSTYESERSPLTLVFYETVGQGDSVSYDPDYAEDINSGNDYRLLINDGAVFEVQLRGDARCLISPAGRISF